MPDTDETIRVQAHVTASGLITIKLSRALYEKLVADGDPFDLDELSPDYDDVLNAMEWTVEDMTEVKKEGRK